jgi:hypothetical protein
MGKPVLEKFVYSLKGENVVFNEMNPDVDVYVIWSILWHGRMKNNQKIWNYAKLHDKPVVVFEVGVFHRGITFRIGINGINRDGIFCNENSPTDRIGKMNVVTHPWKRFGGKYIVICGQHGLSEQRVGEKNQVDYMIETIETLRKYTDRDIIVRPHPRFKIDKNMIPTVRNNVRIEYPEKIEHSYDDFDFKRVLAKAYAVINYSSNTGIESVFNGVPAFVSSHSFCYPLGNTDLKDIEFPEYESRKQFLADLSYTEWYVDEIEKGIPWKKLRPKLEEMI